MLDSPLWPSDMPDDRRVIAVLGMVQILEEGMSNDNEEWKRLNPPAGYVRAYGVDCLNGSLFNKTTNKIPPPSSTTIDPYPKSPDDIALYKESTLVGLMKAAYYDGYTEREKELRESNSNELEKEIARLNALVAMQAGYLYKLANNIIPESFVVAQNTINEALSATSETVSAYQNEVKAKALEEAADWFVKYGPPDTPIEADDAAARELRRMASEKRAKGE